MNVAQTQESKDVPDVLVFPPVIVLTMLVLSLLLGRLFPLRLLKRVGLPMRLAIGSGLSFIGGSTALRAQFRMKQSGTNVSPLQPTSSIVVDGVFERSRNPIYVGGLALYVGIAFAFAIDWAFIFFAPGFAVLHHGVVRPEERYLEQKFGDRYLRYAAKVPRYL
jgi:protein-S-isoprenylcysteine O-methyltransferase Ste14